ncbi:hypothetical protein Godav_008796 [Gossypium davidsonii]|uniref:Uncharacterized protein n=1 Tax=Gossypium davidsonii TaxID=34287 RepID=A0A7J8SBN6_GOSDV|nr:hypothetical protein [Gossypium davidsonii]
MGAFIDFMGKLEWVNSYGKKQCRSLFWRAKAAMKKALKGRGNKKQFKFQYDPSSYALNFDDGYCHSGVEVNTIELARIQDCSECQNDIILVYVLRVKSFSSSIFQPPFMVHVDSYLLEWREIAVNIAITAEL